MPAAAIDVRFHHAIYRPATNEGYYMGFWQTLPATPLASLEIAYGDGTTEMVLPDGSNPLTASSLSHTYALDDGILDTYLVRLTGAIDGGGTVMQQFRFIVDAANTADRSFIGTAFSDVVLGGGGNDTFSGLNGHDLLHGGSGNDLMVGSFGDDTLDGEAGDDTLVGGEGANVVFGGDGADSMLGGASRDFMIGDGVGGGWNDTLKGAGGNDDLFGYGGNDLIIGGLGADYLDGGDGDDRMIGGEGDDSFFANAGNDYARGDAGDDYFDAGDGNDTLVGGAGEDTFRGWAGDDVLRLGALDGVRDVLILNLEVSHGVDRVFDFEVATDLIMIQGIDAIPEARFVASALPRTPMGPDPALLYNTANGRLYVDLDGRGGNAAELIAIFDGLPSLTYADIYFA